MKYFILLTLHIDKFPQYFFTLLKQYDLERHPNLKDIIHVDGYVCIVKRIDYDISDNICFINLDVVDCKPHCDIESEVVPVLLYEFQELEECGWEMFDNDFGKNFDDNKETKIPSEIKKSTNIENMKILFAKAKIDLLNKE